MLAAVTASLQLPMGKCLGKLLRASEPDISVPDVHHSSERSLKQLFDKEQQQQHVSTTEELTAILEEEVSTDGQRYCILEADEVHAEDGFFSSVDSIGSQHESHKELDAVAQNRDSSSDAQETGPHARTSTEERFLSHQHVREVPDFESLKRPEQNTHKGQPESLHRCDDQDAHGQAESDTEPLESKQGGYKERVEGEKESQKEVEAKEEIHNGRAAEGRPTGAEQEEPVEQGSRQHAAEGTFTVAEQKESEESHDGWDSKSVKLSQILHVTQGAPVSEVQQYRQDAGIQIRAIEADANQQSNVQAETNNEAVSVQSVAEPSQASKPTAGGEPELASAHVEATEADETIGTAVIEQAHVDQQPSPPHFVVLKASTVEATEADNKAEEHVKEDCVPGETAVDQPESGSSSESNKPAADVRKELVPERPTSGEMTSAAEKEAKEQHDEMMTAAQNKAKKQHDLLESAPSESAAELVEYPTSGEVASAAERKVEEQHDQLESGPSDFADAGNELVAENPTSGETMSATELEYGPSDFAADGGNEMVTEHPARGEMTSENKVEGQHDQLESGPAESAVDAGNATSGETTSAAEDKVEELHDKLEPEAAPDAGNVHVEQPTSGQTTGVTGSTSESMEEAGNVEQEPQLVAHEVIVENPQEPIRRVISDDSAAEQTAEEAAKHETGEQEPRLQASETRSSESAAEAGNMDRKGSGTFETFIDAEEQFADF